MTITTAFPNQAKLDALKALCPPGNTYKLVLLAPGASFDKTATVYDGTGEVAAGGGYTTGGVTLTGYAASLDTDTAILDFADVSIPNSTISTVGALIVDVTGGNKIRGVFAFGQTLTSNNGPLDIHMPAPAAATAVVRIV